MLHHVVAVLAVAVHHAVHVAHPVVVMAAAALAHHHVLDHFLQAGGEVKLHLLHVVVVHHIGSDLVAVPVVVEPVAAELAPDLLHGAVDVEGLALVHLVGVVHQRVDEPVGGSKRHISLLLINKYWKCDQKTTATTMPFNIIHYYSFL